MNNQCTCVYNGEGCDQAGCQCGCYTVAYKECRCECHDFSTMRHYYWAAKEVPDLNPLKYAEDALRSTKGRQPHSDTWAAFKQWVELFG